MRRKTVILIVAAFILVFGALGCGSRAEVEEGEQEVEEAAKEAE